ncbi:hypothetical protein GCM10027051_35930 [Niabella terrae]
MNYKNVLVVTTSVITGNKIKAYLRPVSAHIVVGANIIRDAFASFSDVFGGRSQSYQKILSSMYKDAIDKIKYEAWQQGANCILGMKVDINEISGGGKSMFMITAIGTAVILEEQSNAVADEPAEINPSFISLENYETQKQKNINIELVKDRKNNMTKELWEYFTEKKISEVYPFLLDRYVEHLSADTIDNEVAERLTNRLTNYIDALPDTNKDFLLYDRLKSSSNVNVTRRLAKLIKTLHLLNLNIIKEMLLDPDFQVNKKGVGLLGSHNTSYAAGDLQKLNEIKEIIGNVFPERGTRKMKKQLLSSKDKEVWSCECGKGNKINIGERCVNCNNDIYGFDTYDVNPQKAIQFVDEKINVLTGFFR